MTTPQNSWDAMAVVTALKRTLMDWLGSSDAAGIGGGVAERSHAAGHHPFLSRPDFSPRRLRYVYSLLEQWGK